MKDEAQPRQSLPDPGFYWARIGASWTIVEVTSWPADRAVDARVMFLPGISGRIRPEVVEELGPRLTPPASCSTADSVPVESPVADTAAADPAPAADSTPRVIAGPGHLPGPSMTVHEAQQFVRAMLALIRVKLGPRSAGVLMVGYPIPGEDHDRFAADFFGPCLTARGLVTWGDRAVAEEIDRQDSSRSGRPHP